MLHKETTMKITVIGAGSYFFGKPVIRKMATSPILAGGTLALVVGGEQKGLRPLLTRHCDFLAAIPMAGPLDSLNASAAAAVAFFEVRRQRAGSGKERKPSSQR